MDGGGAHAAAGHSQRTCRTSSGQEQGSTSGAEHQVTDSLDPEEGGGFDDPYCMATNPGPGPHNYVAIPDLIGNTGTWLICTQCGDFFLMDGTQPPGAAPSTPSSGPPAGTSTSPSKPTWP